MVQEIPFKLVKEIHHIYQNKVNIVNYLKIWLNHLNM